MAKLYFIFVALFLFFKTNGQIICIRAYHVTFFKTCPYTGCIDGEKIKEQKHSVYVSKNKKFFNRLEAFINNIDTLKKAVDVTGLKDARLLIEIDFKGGETKKLYSWFNGDIWYNGFLYERNEYFIKLIEKYFKKISWSKDYVDMKHNP